MNILNFFKNKNAYEFIGDPDKKVEDGGSLICETSQADFYRIKSAENGTEYTFVAYKKQKSFRPVMENLKKLAKKSAPSMHFLWPIEVLSDLEDKTYDFGYLTSALGERYKYVGNLQTMPAFASKEAQIRALFNLGTAFEALIIKGFCYNTFTYCVFADLESGDVLVGDTEFINLNVLARAPGYHAPEVEALKIREDKYTDLYSYALMAFRLLTKQHPYGVHKEEAAKHQHYVLEPVFVFDPSNDSNRLNPQYPTHASAIEYWSVIPDYIKALFIKTFTSGIPAVGKSEAEIKIERQNRTSIKEWRISLMKWLDSLCACPECQRGICLDMSNPTELVGVCPFCGKEQRAYRPVLILSSKKKNDRMVLLDGQKHVLCVLDKKVNDSLTDALAVNSDRKKGVLGLANMSANEWIVRFPNGKPYRLKKGELVPAIDGVIIEFDYETTGRIVYNYDFDAFSEKDIEIVIDFTADDAD